MDKAVIMHRQVLSVGNGDCSQIILANGKRFLTIATVRSEDPNDPRIDLKAVLRQELREVIVTVTTL
jgi:hypothetical protein